MLRVSENFSKYQSQFDFFVSFGFFFFTATVWIRRSEFLWLTRVFDFAIRGNYLYKHLAQKKREKKLFSFVYYVQKRALKENKYPEFRI